MKESNSTCPISGEGVLAPHQVTEHVEYKGSVADLLGEAHPQTLATRASLAQQIGNQGHYAEAEAELRAIWEIARRPEVLGEAHPHTLRTRYWLARMLDAQDRRPEADALLEGLEAQLLASCDEGHRFVRELRAYLAER
jgi:hypothetical protein